MRYLIVCVLLAGTLAFAPAPLPRPARVSGEVSYRALQGKWRIVRLMRVEENGGLVPVRNWPVKEVSIEGNDWAFDVPLPSRGPYSEEEFPSVVLVLDNTRSPATIDFRERLDSNDVEDVPRRLALGIIRRKGDRVEVVFAFGDQRRAESFDRPPRWHVVLMLERKR